MITSKRVGALSDVPKDNVPSAEKSQDITQNYTPFLSSPVSFIVYLITPGTTDVPNHPRCAAWRMKAGTQCANFRPSLFRDGNTD